MTNFEKYKDLSLIHIFREAQIAKQKELKALGPIPSWPKGFPPASGKWNGRVYGKDKLRYIFVDQKIYSLNYILAQQVEEVVQHRAAWRAKAKQIEDKYKQLEE